MEATNHDETMLDAVEPSIEEPITQNGNHPVSYGAGGPFSGLSLSGASRAINGLDTGTQSPIPVSRDGSLLSPLRQERSQDRSEETVRLVTQVNNLLSIESFPSTSTSKRASSDDSSSEKTPERHQLQVAMLPTGLCYDVRMRFHCEIMPLNSTEDHHPEEPRRIYAIYQELCKAGLVDDPMSTRPLVPQPLLRIMARYATPEEICTVHDARHYEFVKSLACR